jgi:hypothetical protein
MARGKDITSIEEIQAELCRLIWKDEYLREKIIQDPKRMIKKLLGVKLSNSLTVKVIDSTEEDVIYLVLPHQSVQLFGSELTDEQLETIAGGVHTMAYTHGVGYREGYSTSGGVSGGNTLGNSSRVRASLGGSSASTGNLGGLTSDPRRSGGLGF